MSEWTELGALALACGTALVGATVYQHAQISRVEKEAAAARETMRRDTEANLRAAEHARENLRKDMEKKVDDAAAAERMARHDLRGDMLLTMGKIENSFGRVVAEMKSCLSLVNEKLEALPGIKAELQALGKQVDRIQPRGES